MAADKLLGLIVAAFFVAGAVVLLVAVAFGYR
jgi:hypothetical protein